MTETCRTSHVAHEWVVSHTWMSHVTHMNESRLAGEGGLFQVHVPFSLIPSSALDSLRDRNLLWAKRKRRKGGGRVGEGEEDERMCVRKIKPTTLFGFKCGGRCCSVLQRVAVYCSMMWKEIRSLIERHVQEKYCITSSQPIVATSRLSFQERVKTQNWVGGFKYKKGKEKRNKRSGKTSIPCLQEYWKSTGHCPLPKKTDIVCSLRVLMCVATVFYQPPRHERVREQNAQLLEEFASSSWF